MLRENDILQNRALPADAVHLVQSFFSSLLLCTAKNNLQYYYPDLFCFFTILELLNSFINVSEIHKIRRSGNFKA